MRALKRRHQRERKFACNRRVKKNANYGATRAKIILFSARRSRATALPLSIAECSCKVMHFFIVELCLSQLLAAECVKWPSRCEDFRCGSDRAVACFHCPRCRPPKQQIARHKICSEMSTSTRTRLTGGKPCAFRNRKKKRVGSK